MGKTCYIIRDTMRYSRYYVKRNFDGSRSVLRMGPIATTSVKWWYSVWGTIFVFIVGDGLIFGSWSPPVALWMLWPMIILAVILHYALVKPRYQREGKVPLNNNRP